jgi:hypothetical protein
MQDFEKLGAFYLGATYDLEKRARKQDLLLYDSRDLVTHAVCVGMTGSGKTGLCVGLIEEAAIDGVPAILIDPKGDLSNLLLTFPDLQPADFLPWINRDEARAQGVSDEEFAAKQAAVWTDGLKDWGQDGARIRRMRDAAEFRIYTPRSSAGLGVSVLGSFDPPPADILEDAELRRERVQAAAGSILALIGMETQSANSREQTLLASIFDHAWRDGKSLDLEGLIGAIQRPPFSRLGALDVNSFYPEKERFELATALNNILASPGFEAWLEGDPLDVARLLHTPEGKPRISIFSISHLNDHERMFFVTLLLNQMVAWMRTQQGTSSLRAILYMDEIFGYFPPVQNPPAKAPLLLLLKQARAFGLGIVLATQNPVDLDYKGLANAGTWFIGRLQTDRDKQRVLDGLEGAAAAAGAGFERAEMDRLLSALGKRVFLMNNVHENVPVLFQTRWTLSYLRGPLGRDQVKQLMAPCKQGAAKSAPAPKTAATARAQASEPLPAVPPGVPQFFAPAPTGAAMRPLIAGAAQVRFADTKLKVDVTQESLFVAPIGEGPIPVNWDDAEETGIAVTELGADPPESASYEPLPPPAAQPKNYNAWKREFTAWLASNRSVRLYRSPSAGLVSAAGESEGDFRVRARLATREARDKAVEDLRRKYAPKVATLEERHRRAQQAVQREMEQAQAEKYQTAINVGTTLMGALFGRKTVSATTLGRAGSVVRSASRARREASDVARSTETLEAVQTQLQDLQFELDSKIAELQAQFGADEALESIEVRPKKTQIAVRLVALVWMPSSE